MSSRTHGARLRSTMGGTLGAVTVLTAVFASVPAASAVALRDAGASVADRSSSNALPAAESTCRAGYSSTLDAASRVDRPVTLPFGIDYPAGGESHPGGSGTNPSGVGYHVDFTADAEGSTSAYSVGPTEAAQGVPWTNDAGTHADGRQTGYALSSGTRGVTYTMTITYDRPVFGMRTALTDLDQAGEAFTLNAFRTTEGGTPIPLEAESLANPATIPELAAGRTHAGDTAYIVDGSKLRADGDNHFSVATSGQVTDSRGSVFFAYDADEPVRRLEMTYMVNGSLGMWFVPPSVPSACVQPNVSVGSAHQGGTARLTTSVQNAAGNARVEDIDFTYRLPEGVRIAADPKTTPGCEADVTAEPGASEFVVRGAAVGSGDTTCAIGLDIVFTGSGDVVFDGSGIVGASNVSVGGTTPVTVPVEQDVAGATVDLAASVVGGGDPAVGEAVVYTATVRNTGNAPLVTAVLDDALGTAMSCSALPIAVGSTATCASTAGRTITQADVDRGSLANTASLVAATAFGSEAEATSDAVTTSIPRRSALAADVVGSLQAAGAHVAPGDTISYRATFRNTGTTTLDSLLVDGAAACAGPVAPGAEVACEVPAHTVDQRDIDAGGVVQQFALAATGADGRVVQTTVPVSVTLDAHRSTALTVESTLEPGDDGRAGAGDVVRSVVRLENRGNVTLSEVAVAISVGTELDCPTTLAPGAAATCESVVRLSQSDVDAGSVAVSVSGTARDPKGDRVEFAPVADSVTLPAAVASQLVASTTTAGDVQHAGDAAVVTATITNEGNVTLHDVAATVDGSAMTACAETLAPGESTTCDGHEVALTQADIDAGGLAMTVRSVGTAPSGAVSTATADAGIALLAAPAAVLDLTASVEVGDDERLDAGDVVRVRPVVRNDGNVTLGSVTLVGLDGAVCDGDVAPGESEECAAVDHVLTQDEVDRGQIEFSLHGSATAPSGDQVPLDEAAVVVALPAVGGLQAETTAEVRSGGEVVGADGDGVVTASVGDVVVWSTSVTNAGATTVRDLRVVGTSEAPRDCAADPIAPGGDLTCVSETTITEADLVAGQVVRTVHVEGRSGTASETRRGLPVTVASAEQTVTIVVAAPIVVTPVPAAPELAFTGTELAGATVLALVLLSGGLGLVVVLWRRRSTPDREARD